MFDYRQRAMRVEVFKDTMARIEAEDDLRQAVSRSIETQQFIAEGADIASHGPTQTSSRRSGAISARSSSPSSAVPGRRGTTMRSGESVETRPCGR